MTLSPWGDGVEESWCPSDKVNCPLVLALLWSSAAPIRNNITHIRWQHVLMYRGTVLPATVYHFCVVYFSFSSYNALITFSCRELIDIGLSLNLYIGLDWHYSTWVSRPSGLRGLLLGAASVADSARKQKWRSRAGYQVQLWKQQHYKPRFRPSSSPTPDPLQTKQLRSEIYYNRVVYRL